MQGLARPNPYPKVAGNYGHDFGDGWQHEVVVEKTLDSERNGAKGHDQS